MSPLSEAYRYIVRLAGVRSGNPIVEGTSDEAVLQFAHERDCVLLTCNRNDFLHLAMARPHHGIVIVIRRRTRADERAA